MPSNPPADSRDSVKAMLLDAGFDDAAAERLITGPPAEARRPVPLVENKGKVEGPHGLGGGGLGGGRHSGTRGPVDGDKG